MKTKKELVNRIISLHEELNQLDKSYKDEINRLENDVKWYREQYYQYQDEHNEILDKDRKIEFQLQCLKKELSERKLYGDTYEASPDIKAKHLAIILRKWGYHGTITKTDKSYYQSNFKEPSLKIENQEIIEI